MTTLADFIRDGCSARPEDKHSALVQLAALESRIAALETKLRSELRCRGLTDAEVESELAAIAAEDKKP